MNTTPKLNKSHEAGRHFIAMNSLLKCVKIYLDFFIHEEMVTGYMKNKVKELDKQITSFENKVSYSMPEDVRSLWSKDWESKDFESVARILEHWVEMNNHDRATLEMVCEEMRAGTFKVVQDAE